LRTERALTAIHLLGGRQTMAVLQVTRPFFWVQIASTQQSVRSSQPQNHLAASAGEVRS